MTKLKRKELVRELREVFDHYLEDLRDYPSEVIVKQAFQQLKEMIEKPEITEEWIWQAVRYIKEYPTYHRLEKILKDAGVKIEYRRNE